jgi:polyhydroxyalkanoate synthesis regulator phasin
MLDDLRSYLQLASGLTEATTAKARDAVTGLLAHGITLGARAMPDPQVVGQVQDLADDLVTTSKANREALVGLIRAEVDKAVARMGFVREDELAALRRHVERLQSELADVTAAAQAAPGDADLVASAEPAAPVETVESVESVESTGDHDAVGAVEPPAKKKKVLVQPDADA